MGWFRISIAVQGRDVQHLAPRQFPTCVEQGFGGLKPFSPDSFHCLARRSSQSQIGVRVFIEGQRGSRQCDRPSFVTDGLFTKLVLLC